MKKIKNRAYFSLLLALGLIFGLCVFAGRLLRNGEDWVMLRANQSVFHNGALDRGRVTDCNDKLLAAAGNGVYYYADDETVRKASLHAVGDFGGNIGSGAITVFNQKLAGYSLINGVASMEGKGGTVRLSIDANLNAVAYQALGGRRGAVLVMNYKTGEILCMVSAPSYDPANPPDLSAPAYEGAFINRGLGATFVPGSVFKLVTLAAAIEQLPDLESRRFSCAGGVTVARKSPALSMTNSLSPENCKPEPVQSCAAPAAGRQVSDSPDPPRRTLPRLRPPWPETSSLSNTAVQPDR